MIEARGAGRSRAAPGPYTIKQQASDVLALATHLDLDPFIFCGHSMGGGVGWHLMCTAPERLCRVVLLAPIPSGGIPNVPAEQQGSRTHVLQHFGWLPVPSFDDALERGKIVTEGRPRETDHWLRDRADAVSSCPEEYWVEGWASIVNFRIPAPVDSIKTPVLMIAGASDGLLKANIRDYLQLQNGTLCVLAEAGHETAHHDPLGTASAIHAFASGSTFAMQSHVQTIMDRLKKRGLPPPAKL